MRQHAFKTNGELLFDPVVIFSDDVIRAQDTLVRYAKKEIGWLGLVDEVADDIFLVREIFVPKQVASHDHCEMDDGALAELYTEIMNRGGDDASKLLFWGHSHHWLQTLPSSQDEEQVNLWSDANQPYVIRGIFNKTGRAQIDIFYFDRGIVARDVPWERHLARDEKIEEYFKHLVDENVSEPKPKKPKLTKAEKRRLRNLKKRQSMIQNMIQNGVVDIEEIMKYNMNEESTDEDIDTVVNMKAIIEEETT